MTAYDPQIITKRVKLVVIPKKEYEKLQRHIAEVNDAFNKIQRGEYEYIKGKTKTINTLDALD